MDERMRIEMEQFEALMARRLALFSPLVESPAWKELCAIGEAQKLAQISELCAAPGDGEDGIKGAMKDQYRKGVIFGINLLLTTPLATIAHAKDLNLANQKETSNAKRQPERHPDLFDTDSGSRLGPNTVVTELG